MILTNKEYNLSGKGIVIKETKPVKYMGVSYYRAEERSVEVVKYKGIKPETTDEAIITTGVEMEQESDDEEDEDLILTKLAKVGYRKKILNY